MTSNAPKAALKDIFRPEFLNRLDEALEFDSLSREQIGKIVRLQLKELEKRLAEEGLTLEISPEAIEVLVSDGYDPQFGARPVKRAIQRDLENPIAKKIIAGCYPSGSTVKANASAGCIVIE
jgi:ATP-dependent Clp protease ATP-binding subunit ClpA